EVNYEPYSTMKRQYTISSLKFPEDLAIVILLTLLCIPFVLIPPLNESPVRIILGLPLVLFLPGYSLIALMFPRKDDLDGIERVALSFGLSIAVVPLLCLTLNYTPCGIRLLPILTVLSVFTVSLAICAYVRRSKLPKANRFEIGRFI
ncbi:putative membrane protein, partial [Candidatus Methanophagaceae archaeon]